MLSYEKEVPPPVVAHPLAELGMPLPSKQSKLCVLDSVTP